MEVKHLLFIAGGVWLGYKLFASSDGSDNRNANNAVNDTTDTNVQHAQVFYNALNVTSTAGRFHTSLKSPHPSIAQYKTLLNTALKVTNLSKVNDTFLKLTNDQLPLTQAAECMESGFYNQFLTFLRQQKVVVKTANAALYKYTNNGTTSEVRPSLIAANNTVLGGLMQANKFYYKIINSVDLETSFFSRNVSPIPYYYDVPVPQAKIVTP